MTPHFSLTLLSLRFLRTVTNVMCAAPIFRKATTLFCEKFHSLLVFSSSFSSWSTPIPTCFLLELSHWVRSDGQTTICNAKIELISSKTTKYQRQCPTLFLTNTLFRCSLSLTWFQLYQRMSRRSSDIHFNQLRNHPLVTSFHLLVSSQPLMLTNQQMLISNHHLVLYQPFWSSKNSQKALPRHCAYYPAWYVSRAAPCSGASISDTTTLLPWWDKLETSWLVRLNP